MSNKIIPATSYLSDRTGRQPVFNRFQPHQLQKAAELWKEFRRLHRKVRGDGPVVVLPNEPHPWKRHEQLVGLFFPHLRIRQWQNPLGEA